MSCHDCFFCFDIDEYNCYYCVLYGIEFEVPKNCEYYINREDNKFEEQIKKFIKEYKSTT